MYLQFLYLQLAPVKARFCFQKLNKEEKRKYFTGLALDCNLWHDFNYFELTENVRQKNDFVFADMLKRIRIGMPSNEDIDLLKTGDVKFLTTQLSQLTKNEIKNFRKIFKKFKK